MVTRTVTGGVVVQIDQAALAHFLSSPTGDVGQWMTRTLHTLRNYAVADCPVRSGRLQSSIQVDGPHPVGADGMEGSVGTDVEYAYWVHEGRGPITAPPGHVLHWVNPNGESVFTRHVGPAAGQPFLENALRRAVL